jgi:hypothetical protein
LIGILFISGAQELERHPPTPSSEKGKGRLIARSGFPFACGWLSILQTNTKKICVHVLACLQLPLGRHSH